MEQLVSRYQDTLDSPRKVREEDLDRMAPSLPSGPVSTIPPPPLLFALLLTLRAKTKDADAKGEKPPTAFSAFYSGRGSEQELLAYHPSSRLQGGQMVATPLVPDIAGVRTAEALRSTGCAQSILGASPALVMRCKRMNTYSGVWPLSP